jgi:hypothetical protein
VTVLRNFNFCPFLFLFGIFLFRMHYPSFCSTAMIS